MFGELLATYRELPGLLWYRVAIDQEEELGRSRAFKSYTDAILTTPQ